MTEDDPRPAGNDPSSERSGDAAAGDRPSAAELASIATTVATEAAELVRSSFGTAATIGTKSSATDVVTRTDVSVEELVRRRLAEEVPGSGFVGEELGTEAGNTPVTWVIDPVDGTVNFLYDLPVVAVSIAAAVAGTAVAGAVADVLREEVSWASDEAGAYRDGEPIRVNQPESLDRALLVTGFSYDADMRRRQAELLPWVVSRARDVRCFGSAALHLCWVACGRVDGYWETDLRPWDVAAGGLIAREAGATVITPATDGGDLTLAAPPNVAAALLPLVAGDHPDNTTPDS